MQKFPPSMQNFIEEIRKSRDAAFKDIDVLKQEREALRVKLKVKTRGGASAEC